jgi:hypothetical protein
VLVLELTAEVGPDLVDIQTVTLQPALTELTFATDPTGLALTAGWETAAAPFSLMVVQGATLELSAPEEQELDGQAYIFDSWGHGGAATHTITVPATAATYTASYISPPAAGTVAGSVFCNASGGLLEPVPQSLVSVAGLSATTNSQGQFSISAVPPGDHLLTATGGTSQCGPGSVPVTVDADDITNVSVFLSGGGGDT